MTTNPAGIWPEIELDDVDLSDMEFWAGPREIHEATFAELRGTPGLRREMTVMFDEIRRRLPSLRINGEPAHLQSNFINGIKRLECSWD